MATFFLVLIGAALGLIGGFIAGAFVGSLIAAATHMSTFEGAAGYFAVFFCGPIGGLLGLVIGVWTALRLRGGPKGLVAVGTYSVASLGALIVGSAAVIMLMLYFDSTLNRGSSKPQALFEIRFPPGTKHPDRRIVDIELNTDRHSASAFLRDEMRIDGDRPVIAGGVELAFRTTSRLLVLKIKGEPDRLFRLNLPGSPGHSDEFGAWQPIDWVAERNAPQPRKATPADQFEIRYRVRDPNVEFGRPIIAFEVSLPVATPVPDDPKSIAVRSIEAQNDMDGAISAESIRREGDRVTLGGTVQLAGETHSYIEISLPNQPVRLFEVTLPPLTWITETIRYATTSPANDTRTFGSWQDVRFIREAEKSELRPARPEDDAKFRYLLR